jgi:hypothetical protein
MKPGVPLRRIRSNSWHAAESVRRPEAVATNKEQLMARRREGERAGVAKLEYARDLGSRGRETVRVRVPPSAPELKRVGKKQ